MIKVVIQTEKDCYVIDENVVYVEIFDGPSSKELVKRYGYTKTRQRLGQGPVTQVKPGKLNTLAAKRVELNPFEAWIEFCLERYRLFWKNFLRD